jgi:hypothetical protein
MTLPHANANPAVKAREALEKDNIHLLGCNITFTYAINRALEFDTLAAGA